jgi:hypothetical protein
MPPQPQNARLASPLAAGQSLDLYQHKRPDHDGQRPAATTAFMRPDLGMQVRPGAHVHRSVAGILARVLGRGLGPGTRVRAPHLRAVATRSPGVGRWTSEARIGVEATPCPQTDEDLTRTSLQCLLHLDGVVASVEDEQRSDTLFRREAQKKRFDLLGGHLVGVLGGAHASHVYGDRPALAGEVEPSDELVGPSSHDRLTGRVAGRMVIVAALGTALRVAAIPHAHVHGVDGRGCSAANEGMADEQFPQSFGIYLSSIQRGVKAASAATVRCFEAQVNGRRNVIRSEEGIGEFEESIGPTVEAFVERVTEGA